MLGAMLLPRIARHTPTGLSAGAPDAASILLASGAPGLRAAERGTRRWNWRA
jgi:hypothetical protein